jgi:hypothetical protein
MKRWFYILLGGFGVCLALTSLFFICFPANDLPPSYVTPVSVCEYLFVPAGLLLGWMGFVNGRDAGEYNVADYIRSSRKRDHHVSGKEINFQCPVCHKGYRASPLLLGRAFTCRDCQQQFEVTEGKSALPPVNERRLLEAS